MANKLALDAGSGCRLLLKHPAIVWLVRHVAWLITRYNTGRDGCSPFRRIFGKSYDGGICKFGGQVHYKLSGHPSSRVEPRWELGAWVGKTELTDEHLLGTISGIRNSRTIYRLPKSHGYSKDALDRIVGAPTNPKPNGAARDPVMRRQYITQRSVDEHDVTPGCPRCEGRGTMTHSETCRKRFEAIEKKKLDKQLEEEAARIPEPPPEAVAEMDVEQPQEQPMMGEASSSSGPAVSVQEAAPVTSPSSHEVRMVITKPSGSTRPLEVDDGESSNKRARSLAGMLLFDENDTSDWQDARPRGVEMSGRTEVGALSSLLFNTVLQYSLEGDLKRWQERQKGIRLSDKTEDCLTNLRFADDVLLFSTSLEKLREMLCEFKISTETVGLGTHPDKTKILSNQDKVKAKEITVDKIEVLAKGDSARYLGQKITFEDQETEEIKNRLKAAWAAINKYRQELTSKELPTMPQTSSFQYGHHAYIDLRK